MYVHVYVYMYMCMCVCLCTCIWLYVYTHVHVFIYIYTYIHTTRTMNSHSSDRLSVVPLLAGGGMFETGAGRGRLSGEWCLTGTSSLELNSFCWSICYFPLVIKSTEDDVVNSSNPPRLLINMPFVGSMVIFWRIRLSKLPNCLGVHQSWLQTILHDFVQRDHDVDPLELSPLKIQRKQWPVATWILNDFEQFWTSRCISQPCNTSGHARALGQVVLRPNMCSNSCRRVTSESWSRKKRV